MCVQQIPGRFWPAVGVKGQRSLGVFFADEAVETETLEEEEEEACPLCSPFVFSLYIINIYLTQVAV